jgi:hypothetical protein
MGGLSGGDRVVPRLDFQGLILHLRGDRGLRRGHGSQRASLFRDRGVLVSHESLQLEEPLFVLGLQIAHPVVTCTRKAREGLGLFVAACPLILKCAFERLDLVLQQLDVPRVQRTAPRADLQFLQAAPGHQNHFTRVVLIAGRGRIKVGGSG